MKPITQISRQNRRTESQRPVGHQISKSPATDWSYQSGADLREATASASPVTEKRAPRCLYGLTQGYFDAATKWEDRIEGLGLSLVVALAALPIAHAIYIAIRTV